MKRENAYQPFLITKLEGMFPDIIIRKHDIQQGWPDLLLLWGPHYGFLEVKRTMPKSIRDYEPNQPWWIDFFNEWAFAAMICPENEREVLDALQRAFTPARQARRRQR